MARFARNFAADSKYSVRQLCKNPGFTVTAVVSLALGIGATTAVFSVIYAGLINPYPYPEVDRIVRLTVQNKARTSQGINLNGPQIRKLSQLPMVASLLVMDFHALTMTSGDLPENVSAIGMISNSFRDLGVPPVLGRELGPGDAVDGQDPQPVAVLAYKFWQKHFLGSPDVVGKTLQLDRKNYTIVGVAAPRFTWYMADVYLPLKLSQDPAVTYMLDLRLKPGVNPRAVDAALQPLLEEFAREMPKHFPEGFRVRVERLNEWVMREIGGTLTLLCAAVGLLLAIGCGNVSILLLARGAARQHELAVRAAVGASSGRLVRQMLTESLVLAGMGVVLGVALSFVILAGIKVVLPRYTFAPEVAIQINFPVLLFSGAIAVVTGILFGLWPAIQLSRAQLGRAMQSGTRRVAGSVHGQRTHSGLIAGQIALTLLLLAGAGSAMEAFRKFTHTPLGYDPHHVMAVGIPLHDNSYTTWAARGAYFEQLLAKVAETPGVGMAAISTNAVPPRSGWNTQFEIMGKPAPEQQLGSVNLVSPGYFATLCIPLAAGRIWSEQENHAAAHVAVINRTLAQHYFPNGDALGHALRLPGVETRPPVVLTIPNVAETWLAIVGIVEDSRNDGVESPVKPAVYVPFTFSMSYGTQILVRSEAPPLTLLRGVKAQLAAVNADQQTYTFVEELEEWISDEPEWQREHLTAWIFSAFAVLALALAAVGLYSVVSYTVAQRRNEFGIRVALGAGSGHVLRLVFGPVAVSVGIGLAVGLGLSLGLGTTRDPSILMAGAVVLSLAAGVAGAIPARQACRVDPMTALRCE